MGTIITLLIFLLPFGLFLLNAWRVRSERGPRGITGERVSAKEAKPPWRPARKARIRAIERDQDCGRHFNHFLLTVTGSRGSCKGCATLDSRMPVPIRKGSTPEPDEEADPEAPPDEDEA